MSAWRRMAAAALAAAWMVAAPAQGDDGWLPEALRTANAATEAAATLRSEVERMSKDAGTPAMDARIALRRVAFDLLFRGNAAGADAQAMAMAGFRLSWLRAEIDAALQAAPTNPARAAEHRAAVTEFAAAAGHGVDAVPAPDRPEAALGRLLAPLERAIAAAAEGNATDPGTAWPPASALGPQPSDGGPALADPSRAHRQPADDAARIAAIPGWIDAVKACSARGAGQFEASTKAWRTALRDRTRQAAARTSMDAFAAELALTQPSAFEQAVRAGDAAARAACAGRPDQLLAELDRCRAAWAVGWSNGRGSTDATGSLRQAVRVTQALAEVARAAATDADLRHDATAPLAAWGGAAMLPGGWRIHPKALAAHAALALEAMLDRKADVAEQELVVLERDLPLARLERAAAERLARWLPSRGGLRARIRAAADGPGEGAWMGAARADLMLAARLLVEEARARAMREDALATELRSRAAEAAARALGAARLPG